MDYPEWCCEFVQLISGISILLVVLYNPDGVAVEWAQLPNL